jgi:hypothetical protein
MWLPKILFYITLQRTVQRRSGSAELVNLGIVANVRRIQCPEAGGDMDSDSDWYEGFMNRDFLRCEFCLQSRTRLR